MIFCSFRSIVASYLVVFNLFVGLDLYSQSCPTYSKRNNGAGTSGCYTPVTPPFKTGSTTVRKEKTGQFEFSYTATLLLDSIMFQGQLYQKGDVLYNNLGTIWFGNLNEDGTTDKLCFYGDSQSDNTPPAGRWQFIWKQSGGTSFSCSYVLSNNSTGSLLNFDPGTISSNQTICKGGSTSTLTGTNPSGCDAPSTISYQWRESNDGITYADVSSNGTSSSYSPGVLNQTKYYIRIATCSNGATANSDPIKITVLDPGTISPQPGSTWSGSTTTFSSNGTSGGSWTIATSPASGVATIDPSTGLLTASAAGTGTVTYTVTSGSTTCSSTRSFTISGTSGSLPVTWETVSAEKQNGQSVLRWSTASEQNTKDFVIQHSLNTTDWSSLSTIPAAGNSTTTRNYSYVHQNPLKGNNYNYYRILQRDLDGKFSYSKIVSIIFNEPGADLQVYPNPVHDQLTVFLAETQMVRLVNAAGASVWKGQLPAGRNTIPVQTYSKGVYVLTTGTQSFRVLIQ